MIILDESLMDQRIIDAIARWYPGKVTDITTLRPRTIIKDDIVPQLLLTISRPTFVTNNVGDFWRRVQPHSGFCVVGFEISQEEARDLSGLLRRLLTISEFRTKALRMGKVILVRGDRLRYYARDGNIHTMNW